MQAFETVRSIVAYLPLANVDTDMIIPKEYLKTTTRTGLGRSLFAELRYEENGDVKSNFILNQAPYTKANILIAEENFGCGSSREHAVWALLDFGFKVIIARSFADIFYNNCFKNGILPIVLAKNLVDRLAQEKNEVIVNLEEQIIIASNLKIAFDLDKFRRECLLQGLDEIGETLMFEDSINVFERQQNEVQPWLYENLGAQ